GGRALPLHPAPARRAAGLCPAPRACAAGGRALPCTRWGSAPDPEMLTHLCSPAGGTGAGPSAHRSCSVPRPPERRRAGRGREYKWEATHLVPSRTKSRWHNDASDFF
ncbi:hypothetical protein D7X33_05535, partial [Butyricicoccus sp. 1XD8-22]